MGKSKHTARKKSEMKMLKKIVIGVFVYWITFVITMTVIFCIKGAVPDTLIQFGLGGGAFELFMTALIEVVKSQVDTKEDIDNESEYIRDSDSDSETDSSGSGDISDTADIEEPQGQEESGCGTESGVRSSADSVERRRTRKKTVRRKTRNSDS